MLSHREDGFLFGRYAVPAEYRASICIHAMLCPGAVAHESFCY